MDKKNNSNTEYKFNAFERALNGLERLGNLLPSPFTIFFVLFLVTAVASLIVGMIGVTLVNPANGEAVTGNNIFSVEGITWLLQSLVTNFTGYAPFGLVLVMTLGIGLCEEVGLVNALIRRVMVNVPK
ncbi:MAG: AbgT family transporter, partial [Clostridiales bacterium]|nr:AbgT family transporter [Clostridiales bacterium]